MIRMMKIMLKINIIKNSKKKNYNPCEWSLLTITITITTNKTLIIDKTVGGEESKKQTKYLFATSKLWKDYLAQYTA